MTDSPQKLERRCPRLGGAVAFEYCMQCEDNGRPCGKIMDCWWEIFDVVGYLRQCLPEEEIQRLAASRPKPKVTSLVELIQQAKDRAASGTNNADG